MGTLGPWAPWALGTLGLGDPWALGTLGLGEPWALGAEALGSRISARCLGHPSVVDPPGRKSWVSLTYFTVHLSHFTLFRRRFLSDGVILGSLAAVGRFPAGR